MYEKRNNNNNARNRKILLTAWGVVIVVAITIAGLVFHLGKIVVVDGFGQVKEIKQ